jgi:hypothetical protein
MKEAPNSSETSVLTRAAWRNLPENLKSYIVRTIHRSGEHLFFFSGHKIALLMLCVEYIADTCFCVISVVSNVMPTVFAQWYMHEPHHTFW